MARYPVTGGAGFIGSHLCEQLLADGHAVRVIDDLSTGRRENLPDGVEFIEACISDRTRIESAFNAVDGCFHLAAIASVQRSCEHWPATHAINLGASIGLLDCARARSLPLVYASSAAVYGDRGDALLSEHVGHAPLSPYGADKAALELHAQAAAASFALGTTGLRFFNVYGPRQDPHSPYSGVISIFAQRLTQGLDVCIHGDGEQTRDFIYVSDVVRYLTQAMRRCRSGQAGVFNVCTGQRSSILDLAHTLAALLDCRPAIRFGPARAGDIRHSAGDPGLAIKALEHQAEVSLSDGLNRLLDSLN